MSQRIVLHLDMDAFFAAVEERDKPRIKGLPIVVGADPNEGRGRGVVSTANYAARAYGIHSALPISVAWRLSEEAERADKPAVVFLPVDFKRYGEVSDRIMEISRRYASIVEVASIDEAYADISFAGSYEKAEKLARKIKREIFNLEKLTASFGIGPNKMVAKIAAGSQKPNGFTVVRPEEAQSFLDPLPASSISGIGPKSAAVLAGKNIKTIADLRGASQVDLEEWFGKWGLQMYERARGRDESPIVTEYEAKSIGEQETFKHDTLDAGFLLGRLGVLAGQVYEKVTADEFVWKRAAITVRFHDFQTQTRQQTIKSKERSLGVFKAAAMQLFLPFLDQRENPRKKLIRLIGVRAE